MQISVTRKSKTCIFKYRGKPEAFTLLTILLQNVTFRPPIEPNVLQDMAYNELRLLFPSEL